MDTRFYKIFIRVPGGNASKNAKGYSLSLPPKWVQALGITPENRVVKLSFDGSSINIKKADPKEYSEETESEIENA